jgi:hypothetical protein
MKRQTASPSEFVITVLVSVLMLACNHNRKSELNELRRLAFDEANKRYVLTDAAIESQYSQYHPHTPVPCPQQNPKESFNESMDRVRCEATNKRWREQEPPRIPAVSSVRGVELSPSSQASIYFIKFDFEPSANPHTELPKTKATAERFEKADGTHYWVIVWE